MVSPPCKRMSSVVNGFAKRDLLDPGVLWGQWLQLQLYTVGLGKGIGSHEVVAMYKRVRRAWRKSNARGVSSNLKRAQPFLPCDAEFLCAL